MISRGSQKRQKRQKSERARARLGDFLLLFFYKIYLLLRTPTTTNARACVCALVVWIVGWGIEIIKEERFRKKMHLFRVQFKFTIFTKKVESRTYEIYALYFFRVR